MTISNRSPSNQVFNSFICKDLWQPRARNRALTKNHLLHSNLLEYERWKQDNPSASEEERKAMANELRL